MANVFSVVFPDEILWYICGFLSTVDKLRLSCVCTRLRNLITLTPSLHRTTSFKHCWHVPSDTIELYIKNNHEWIHELNLQDCYWLKQPMLVKSLNKCHNLVALDIRGCVLSQKNVLNLMNACPNLRDFGWSVDKLTLFAAANVTVSQMSSINQLNSCFRNLSSLKLEFCARGIYHVNLFDAVGKCLLILLRNLQLQSLEVEMVEGGCVNILNSVNMALKRKGNSSRAYIPVDAKPFPSALESMLLVNEIVQIFPLHYTTTLVLSSHRDIPVFCLIYWKTVQDSLLNEDIPLVNLDISRFWFRHDRILSALVHSTRLQYVNLSSAHIKESQLHIFSHILSSPFLQTLNLGRCSLDVEPDFTNCSRLQHLNLVDTNIWTGSLHEQNPNQFNKILCNCRNLISLAMNPCCITSTAAGDSSLLLSTLVYVTELELIGSNFESDFQYCGDDFTKYLRKQSHCATLSSASLASLARLKNLRKLTLAGFSIDSSDFLVAISEQCTQLEFLSLAQLKGPVLNHSGNIASFIKALTHLYNLKDFRFEQQFFNISKLFLNGLHNAQQLRRVCLMAKHGTLAVEEIEPWLEKSKKIIFVQMFCDVTKKMGSTLKKHFENKFCPHRPGFIFNIYPFAPGASEAHGSWISANSHSIRTDTPLVHLREMTMFASRVATKYEMK